MERIRPKLIFLGLLAQKLTFGALAFIGAAYVFVWFDSVDLTRTSNQLRLLHI